MAEKIIPKLREDIELSYAGKNQWTLYDRATNKYFRLSELSFSILLALSQWDGQGDILSLISPDLECSKEDIEETLNFCERNFLFRLKSNENIENLIALNTKKRNIPLYTKLIHSYLFFKIHFFNPDKFLEKTLFLSNIFFNKIFFWIMAFLFGINLIFIFNRFSEFSSTLANFVSLEGFIYVAISIVIVKTFHEFAHAYTAKRAGCTVPSMGVAFMVFYPMPYTDTTDAWRLDKSKRMQVALAGIKMEMILAIFTMIAWLWLPDGTLKSLMFFVITVSMISTLFVNLTPFMRFDGYYALSDYLEIENLHTRSFLQAKAFVKKMLWGINIKVEYFSQNMRIFLIIFAIKTWIYRVVLFSGIAYLVYSHTFKALGIILFWIEIWYFILIPIIREIKEWYQLKSQIKFNAYILFTWVGILGFFSIIFVPYTSTIRLPAVIDSAQKSILYAEYDSQITYIKKEGRIKKGDLIISAHSTDNKLQKKIAQRKSQLFRKQSSFAFVSLETLKDTEKYKQSLYNESMKIGNAESIQNNMNIYAPADGILYYEKKLLIGDFIGNTQQVGYIIDPNSIKIRAYINDVDLSGVKIESKGAFLDELTLDRFDVFLKQIDNTPTEILKEPLLNSNYKGSISVSKNNIPQRPIYELTLNTINNTKIEPLFYQHYGEVSLDLTNFSLFQRLINATISFFLIESEF